MSDLLDSDTSSLNMEMLHTGRLCLCVTLNSFSKTRQPLTSHSLIYADPLWTMEQQISLNMHGCEMQWCAETQRGEWGGIL